MRLVVLEQTDGVALPLGGLTAVAERVRSLCGSNLIIHQRTNRFNLENTAMSYQCKVKLTLLMLTKTLAFLLKI